jgi:excisionase family DNA binding protein
MKRQHRKREVYTVPEAARILRVSAGVVYRAVATGVIPVIDLGDRRPLRIPARWLDDQLAPDFARYPPLQSGDAALPSGD